MLFHFLLGFIVSFLGSIPIGILNLSVVELTLNKGLRTAIWFACGAAFVEYGQAFIAVKFSVFLVENEAILYWMNILVIPVFLILGIIFFLERNKKTSSLKDKITSGFGQGVYLALLNPMAIPFWVTYATYLGGKGLLTFTNIYIAIFVLGISLGTIATFVLYGVFSRYIKDHLQRVKLWFNEIIGSIFIFLAILQIWNMFFH